MARRDADFRRTETQRVAQDIARTEESVRLSIAEKRIEALEKEQTGLAAKLSDPIFYKTAGAKFAEVKTRLDAVDREYAAAFARWEELEARRDA